MCGITNLDDALMCARYGADALGFVFYENSPRNIDIDTASKIISKIPAFISPVAVLVDRDMDFMLRLLNVGFCHFQIYFGLTDDEIEKLRPAKIIRAIRIGRRREIKLSENYDALLLDTYVKDAIGGTGKTFDWEIARRFSEDVDKPIILAGGLTPENVSEAIRIAMPYGVDVSSGVEKRPGIKDEEKVFRFISSAINN